MRTIKEIISNSVWLDGTLMHKYNEALNMQVEEASGMPNDRTNYDTGEELNNNYEETIS